MTPGDAERVAAEAADAGAPAPKPWDAVAPLRVRLRGGLVWSHQAAGGRAWRIARNPLSGRCVRLDRAGFDFLGRLDGSRTAADALAATRDALGGAACDEDEALALIAFATEAGLLGQALPPAAAGVVRRRVGTRRRAGLRRGLSVLFWRQHAFSPDRLLERAEPVLGVAFSRPALLLWLAAVSVGIAHLLSGLDRLGAAAAGALRFDPGYLAGALGVFVGLKALHELAHGVACKRFGRLAGVPGGCEVPDTGIMLLVALPVPYIDVTSAWLIPSRWHRAVVSAAGLYAELFVAALAAAVWFHTGPGVLNTLAFQTVLIASVATFLFNANPLLRYDGYHALADLAGVANLGQRANALVSGAALRLLGVPGERAMAATPGGETAAEAGRRIRALLVGYAVASTAYRWLLLAVIIAMVGTQWLLLGQVLAAMAFVGWVVLPGWAFGRRAAAELARAGRGRAARWRVGGVALAAAAVAAAVPLPRWATAPGVAEARAETQIRPRVGGFVEAALPAGAAVRPGGSPLLKLSDPEIAADRSAAAATLASAEARWRSSAGRAPSLLQAHADRVRVFGERLAEADRHARDLTVAAPRGGVWLPTDPHLAAGAWVPAGSPVGTVLDLDRVRARLVADQHLGPVLLQQLRPGDAVGVRTPAGTAKATVLAVAPAGSTRLPSPALGLAGGGELATAEPPAGGGPVESAEPGFEVLVELEPGPAAARLAPGTRVRGVFPLASEAAGTRALRWGRQLLLKR